MDLRLSPRDQQAAINSEIDNILLSYDSIPSVSQWEAIKITILDLTKFSHHYIERTLPTENKLPLSNEVRHNGEVPEFLTNQTSNPRRAQMVGRVDDLAPPQEQ